MWRGPVWVTVVRDLACLVLGVWGVIHQELSPRPDVAVMVFFGTLMVAPGLLATHWLVQQSVTGGQSSERRVPPSSSSSSSPGSTSPGGG